MEALTLEGTMNDERLMMNVSSGGFDLLYSNARWNCMINTLTPKSVQCSRGVK